MGKQFYDEPRTADKLATGKRVLVLLKPNGLWGSRVRTLMQRGEVYGFVDNIEDVMACEVCRIVETGRSCSRPIRDYELPRTDRLVVAWREEVVEVGRG